jgi:hypothetical protein
MIKGRLLIPNPRQLVAISSQAAVGPIFCRKVTMGLDSAILTIQLSTQTQELENHLSMAFKNRAALYLPKMLRTFNPALRRNAQTH